MNISTKVKVIIKAQRLKITLQMYINKYIVRIKKITKVIYKIISTREREREKYIIFN